MTLKDLSKQIGTEIASVDSHFINTIGPGGTVAEQIISRELKDFVNSLWDKIQLIIAEEINTCRAEGQPTSRLTAASNKIHKLLEE